MKKEDIGEQIL